MLSENMWFTWCQPSNYSIFGEGKSDYGQTDTHTHRQTHRISYLRLDPFCGRGRVKINTIIGPRGPCSFLPGPMAPPLEGQILRPKFSSLGGF